MPTTRAVITLTEAEAVAHRVLAAAATAGLAVAVVVTDPWGEPVVAVRMDDVSGLVARAAQGKAGTAAAFGVPTSVWQERAAAEPAFPALVGTVPGFTPLSGGCPIRVGAEVVGAVGVSGGTSEQDDLIARAAAGS